MENLLLSYARDLNDAYPGHEFSIWTKHQLLEWFNEGLCLIAAQSPHLFEDIKVVKVDPCNNYLDLCDCNKILEVLGQATKDGKLIKRLSRRKHSTNGWTGKVRLSAGLTTELTEYEVLKDSNLVQVFPANIDPTKDIYVLVRCSIDAENYDLEDDAPSERCAFMAAARHYVLYNAKMMDAEFSPSMREAGKEHRDMFTGILTLVKTADDTYNEEKKTKPS